MYYFYVRLVYFLVIQCAMLHLLVDVSYSPLMVFLRGNSWVCVGVGTSQALHGVPLQLDSVSHPYQTEKKGSSDLKCLIRPVDLHRN